MDVALDSARDSRFSSKKAWKEGVNEERTRAIHAPSLQTNHCRRKRKTTEDVESVSTVNLNSIKSVDSHRTCIDTTAMLCSR